jgi:hypothetical protein
MLIGLLLVGAFCGFAGYKIGHLRGFSDAVWFFESTKEDGDA